jgi:hypothetical protein
LCVFLSIFFCVVLYFVFLYLYFYLLISLHFLCLCLSPFLCVSLFPSIFLCMFISLWYYDCPTGMISHHAACDYNLLLHLGDKLTHGVNLHISHTLP